MYSAGAQCTDPDQPVLSQTVQNCSVTLSIASGNLNDATYWQWYEGSCGSSPVGTGTSINVNPATATTYYAQGLGGCVLTGGPCASITVTPGTLTAFYPDADGDAYGSSIASPLMCSTQPAGYVADNTDCNDNSNVVHPGEPESCNGIDDDCDAVTDNGLSFIDYYTDSDGDGYGTGAASNLCADPGAGYATIAGDCNDLNVAQNPGETEVCNNIDDNCIDGIDEGFTAFMYYADGDGDFYGTGDPLITCVDPGPGYVIGSNGDCNDSDPDINPGADEICNGIDDNCDGIQVTYTITVVQPANGVITPAGPITVNCGADSPPFFTIANAGYIGSDIYVDNVFVGVFNPYTLLNVTGDHTITAQFTAAGCANPPAITPGGASSVYCSNAPATFTVNINNASGVSWTTDGDGLLTNPVDANPDFYIDYEPAFTDIGNTVTVTATTDDPDGGGPCVAATYVFSFTVVAPPTVDAGTYPAFCEDGGLQLLSGTPSGGVWSGSTAIVLQSGQYYFDPAVSGIGNFVIEYNYFDGTCNGTNQAAITVEECNVNCTDPVVANAGPDLNICILGDGTLGGTITGAVTGGHWVGGAGSFTPDRLTLNATYTPAASEAGTIVTLRLVSDTPLAPCVADSDEVQLTISVPYDIDAGPDIRVCVDEGSVQLNAQVYAGGPGVLWTGGTGTFIPGRDVPGPVYIPSAAEAGTVITLTLNGANPDNVCPPFSDDVLITVDQLPIANAGSDQTSCGGGQITLNGASTYAAGGVWSGGSGTFTPDEFTGNAVYTPSVSELNSTITLTWTTSDPENVCPVAMDDMDLVIEEVTVNAGPDIHVCVEDGSVGLFGEVNGGTGTGTWSGGIGTFDDASSPSTIYHPALSEAGSTVVLTLSSTGSVSCPAVTDQMSIFVDDVPLVNAGPDISTCVDGFVNLNAQVSGGTALVVWSGGQGSFNDVNDPAAVYTPALSEAGTVVTLTINAYGAPGSVCNPTFDEVDVTVDDIPVADAGSDQSVCWNTPVNISGTITHGTTGVWTSSGTGSFLNAASLTTVYTPSAADLSNGFVVLTLTADVNGQCPGTSSDITITFYQQVQVLAETVNVNCNGESNGSIDVNVTGGTSPYSYQLNSGTFQGSDIFNALPAGTYTITVEDVNGCTGTATVTITEPPVLVASGAVTSPILCNGQTGIIHISATGGTPPYDGTGDYTVLAGTWNYTVTDAHGCFDVVAVTITEPLVLNLSLTSENVSCFGGSNGSATATVTGGTTPYSYAWSGGQSTASISGLSAGTYTVTVTDFNGCVNIQSVTITQPAALSIAFSNSHVSCNGGSNGSSTALPAGGTSPYTYAWSDGQTSQTATGLTAGQYTVTVTDAHGCIHTSTTTITEPLVLNVSLTSENVSCFGGSNGSATATVTGGTTPYSYAWSGGQSTASISGLSAGTYTVTVTDFNGCINVQSVTITQPAALTVTFTNTNVSCNGDNNGSSMAVPVGGTSPYSYAWSNGQTSQTATGLFAGQYTVTVTDAHGCVTTSTTTITEPLVLDVIMNAENVSCFGGSDGSATATVSGGTTPYAYAWSNGQSTASISGLSAGTYTLTVTDFNGCTNVQIVIIGQPMALSVSTSNNNISCNGGSNGSSTANPSGGTAPYTYLWSNGQTTQTATGLSAGQYTVTVTDAHLCVTSSATNITEPAVLTVVVSTVNVACFGESNGSATANVSGGTSPYGYLWSNSETTQSVTGLSAGTYTVTVTDFNGCVNVQTVTITQPAALTISFSNINVSCNGGSNGSSTAMPAGGTAPFTYLWSNGQTTQTASGLSAGQYTVTVTDAHLCVTTSTTTITEPLFLTIGFNNTHVSCSGGSNGSSAGLPSGGTAPYTYLWSNGQTTQTATGLSAGTYTLTVTDANFCVAVAITTITQPAVLNVSLVPVHVSCFNGNNGSIAANVSGGTPPYAYAWSNSQSTSSVSGLIAGTYTVTVTDFNGCINVQSVAVTQPVQLTLSFTKTNVSCNGGNNGTATVLPSGGTGPYTYLWSNSQTSQTATGLSAGQYTVTVTDANNCTPVVGFVIITEPTLLTVSTTQTNVNCNGGSTGSATAAAAGGTSPYSYVWSNGQLTATATGLSAGTYTVTATDANGCTAVKVIVITQATVISLTFVKNDVQCFGELNGTATVLASGGTPGYTYLWSTGSSASSVTDLAAGTYTVTVTDNFGCTAVSSVLITQPTAVSAGMTHTNVSCFGGSNGTATVSPTGGTPGYVVQWSNGQTSLIASGLSAGTYTVTVTDTHGCTFITTVAVTQPATSVSGTLSHTNTSCFGGSNGTASVSGTGGIPGYTYLWSTGQTTATISGLSAATYTVTVTDANGCTAVLQVVVSQPSAVSPNLSKVSPTCFGAANGSATASPTGGTPGYTYLWSNGQTTATISGLINSTYTVTVTDANGCTAVASILVNQPAMLSVTTSRTNVTCNGAANGTATANPAGGNPPYTFLWSNGQTTQTITGLGPGIYSVTVNDINGCGPVSANAVISQPAQINISFSNVNVTCFGGANGSSTATASGSVAPYTYLWSNGQTGQTATGLSAGTYTVTVTNANGCTRALSTVITQPAAVVPVLSSSNVSCFGGANGTATASGSGGTGSYTFLWSGGQTTATMSGLVAGTYTVTVTDGSGCTGVSSVTLTEPPALSASAIENAPILCNGGSTTVTVSAIGGTPPYSGTGTFTRAAGNWTFNVSDANGCTIIASITISQPALLVVTPTPGTILCHGGTTSVTLTATGGTGAYTFGGDPVTNLTAGTYTYTVTDANNCIASATITISEPPLLQLTAIPGTIACNGGTTNVTLSATGGTGAYTFGGDPVINVTAGTYTYSVTDANNCTASATITITEPALLTLDAIPGSILCHNGTTSVTLQAAGGTSPYTYGGDPVSNVGAGTYTYSVTDAHNCTASITITINEPTQLTVSAIPGNIICHGGTTNVSLSASGGTGAYTFGGDPVNNVTAGTYTFTVTDANNCIASTTITITEPAQLVVNAVPGTIACNGGTTNVTLSATGGTGAYTFGGDPVSNVMAGSYTYTVTDINNCTASTTITISQPAVLTINAVPGTILCFGGTTSVTLSANGGNGGYVFGGDPATNLHAGTYTYTVTDINNCGPASVTITINEPSQLTGSAAQDAPVLCHGGTTTVTVSATGGVSPYSGTGTFSVTAGPHSYNITDANGCTAVASVTVTEPDALVPAESHTPIACAGGTSTVTISATGGTPPYSGTGNFPQSAGSHIYTVTDVNNCTSQITVTITVDDTEDPVIHNCPGNIVQCNSTVTWTEPTATDNCAVSNLLSSHANGSTFPVGVTTVTYTATDSNGNTSTCTFTVTITAPTVWYADNDIDGYGNLNATLSSCTQPSGYVADNTDCNDNNSAIHPGATEICDNIDNDCDGMTDEGLPVFTYYADADGDNYGSNSNFITTCQSLPPMGYLTISGDCDDANAAVHPGVTEICNGIDDDCDGSIDNGTIISTYYADTDGDGYGDMNVSVVACVQPAGYVSDNTDCNDAQNSIHPGATELCNGIDEDCDGVVDDNAGVVPGSISGSTIQCIPFAPGSATYTIAPVSGASGYNWTVPAGMIIVSGQGTTTLNVNWSSIAAHDGINGQLCVSSTNACGSSFPSCTTINLSIVAPVTPPSISGPSKICAGDAATYSIAPVARAAAYTWTVPAGVNIVSGQGSNVLHVSVTPAFAGGTLAVNASNACGTSPNRTRALNFNTLPVPSPISGSTTGVCGASSVVYTVPALAGASGYLWTVPAGATINSGQGTVSISVTFTNSYTSGSVTVAGVNNCGPGVVRSLSVIGAPGQPAPVSGPTAICPGQTGVIYSVPTVAGAVTYTWTVPTGAVIVNGQGSKIIEVDYGTSPAANQIITVKATNACGTGGTRVLSAISINSSNCPVRVGGEPDAVYNVHAWPNPARDEITVSFELAAEGGCSARLVDISGRIVLQESFPVMAGSNEKHFDLQGISTGVYFMILETAAGSQQVRIIVE